MLYKPLSKIAGENLKYMIKGSKYRTQDAFAYAFGAETRTVNRWLNEGIKNVDTLQEIAYFLSVEIADIIAENK